MDSFGFFSPEVQTPGRYAGPDQEEAFAYASLNPTLQRFYQGMMQAPGMANPSTRLAVLNDLRRQQEGAAGAPVDPARPLGAQVGEVRAANDPTMFQGMAPGGVVVNRVLRTLGGRPRQQQQAAQQAPPTQQQRAAAATSSAPAAGRPKSEQLMGFDTLRNTYYPKAGRYEDFETAVNQGNQAQALARSVLGQRPVAPMDVLSVTPGQMTRAARDEAAYQGAVKRAQAQAEQQNAMDLQRLKSQGDLAVEQEKTRAQLVGDLMKSGLSASDSEKLYGQFSTDYKAALKSQQAYDSLAAATRGKTPETSLAKPVKVGQQTFATVGDIRAYLQANPRPELPLQFIWLSDQAQRGNPLARRAMNPYGAAAGAGAPPSPVPGFAPPGGGAADTTTSAYAAAPPQGTPQEAPGQAASGRLPESQVLDAVNKTAGQMSADEADQVAHQLESEGYAGPAARLRAYNLVTNNYVSGIAAWRPDEASVLQIAQEMAPRMTQGEAYLAARRLTQAGYPRVAQYLQSNYGNAGR